MCNKQCSHCRWWGPVELHRNLLGVPSPSLRVFQALCLDRFRCPRCTPTAPSLFFCVCLASNTTSATCTLRDRGLLSIVLSDGDLCSVVYSCLLTVGDSSFTPLLRVSRAQVVATVQGLLGDRRIAAYCFFLPLDGQSLHLLSAAVANSDAYAVDLLNHGRDPVPRQQDFLPQLLRHLITDGSISIKKPTILIMYFHYYRPLPNITLLFMMLTRTVVLNESSIPFNCKRVWLMDINSTSELDLVPLDIWTTKQ